MPCRLKCFLDMAQNNLTKHLFFEKTSVHFTHSLTHTPHTHTYPPIHNLFITPYTYLRGIQGHKAHRALDARG